MSCHGKFMVLPNLLIASGARLEVTDRYSSTALHFAAQSGSNDIISLLIKKGANIEARDRTLSTPLK